MYIKYTQIMQVIILAGGFGTRLRGVVNDVPKPLAPVNGRPFIDYIIANLRKQNVAQIHISVHYMPEKFTHYYGNDQDITIHVESEPLGTGGAIAYCMEFVDSENILVMNGDSFIDIDVNNITTNAITVAVAEVNTPDRYGTVEFNARNIITRFVEKQIGLDRGFINTGVYLINKKFFIECTKALPRTFSFETVILQPFATSGKLQAHKAGAKFIDIGIPEDYLKAGQFFNEL